MHRSSFYLAFLGFACLLAVVASRDEEEKEIGSGLKPVRVADGGLSREAETVEGRSARSAGRGDGKKDGASKKKGRNPKRKTGKNKDKNSEKGKGKGKKNAEGRRERKRKQTKRRRMRKKGMETKGKGRGIGKGKGKCPPATTRTASASRAINETCLANIVTVIETYYKQVKNFEKQWKRIESKNKTSVSKGGKMDAFKKPLERLVEAGGGNLSSLNCQGQTTSPGALQMQNLSSILTNCSADIKDACSESQKPTINMTEVDKCNAMIAEFETIVAGTDGCLKKTGEDLCDCFNNQTLLDQAAVLRKCSLATESKAMATALKTCKGSFGDCRKYKEEIIDIVSACSKPLDKQKEKAKTLSENVNNIKAAQGAVASLTGSRRRRFFKDRFSFDSTSAFFINQNHEYQVTSSHTNRLCWFHHGCPAGGHPGGVQSGQPGGERSLQGGRGCRLYHLLGGRVDRAQRDGDGDGGGR